MMTRPLALLLLALSGLVLSAAPAAAWSDAGEGYCPTATLRPAPGTIPVDLPHLLVDGYLPPYAFEAHRIHPDGRTERVELEVTSFGSVSYAVAVAGGWVDGAVYELRSPSSACPAQIAEYRIGPSLGTPLALGTVRTADPTAIAPAGALADVWLELAPEARPFVGIWDVELHVGAETRALGTLEDPTETFLRIACHDTAGYPPGDLDLSFHAGPPGEPPVVQTDVRRVHFTCPAAPAPTPDAESGADAGPGGGAPGGAACAVSAPGLGGGGSGVLAVLALAVALRRRRG